MSGFEVVPDPWIAGAPGVRVAVPGASSQPPGTQPAASWLRAHGYVMVAIPVMDLLSVVARLEQVKDDPAAHPVTFDRLFTCDLPRLRSYLPPEALEELDR